MSDPTHSNKSSWIKYVILSGLFVAICFAYYFLPKKSEYVPDNKVAESVEIFKNLIYSDNYKKFGFENESVKNNFKIREKQYKKYFIEFDQILNYNGSDLVDQIRSKDYSIDIPIYISDSIASVIEFRRNSLDKWEGAAYGYEPLFYSLKKAVNLNSRNDYLLVEVPALNNGFYLVRDQVTGKLKGKLLNNMIGDTSFLKPEIPDTAILNQLKKQAQKIDFRYPG